MRLCAIVKNGKIIGIVPVSDTHEFGDREGYSHIETALLDTMPVEFDAPKKAKDAKKIVFPLFE